MTYSNNFSALEMEFFDNFPKAIRDAINAVDGKVHCWDVYERLQDGKSIASTVSFIYAESARWIKEEQNLYRNM